MKGLLLITCFLVFASFKLYAQSSNATASANIITPVGAEITGEIDALDFIRKISKTSAGINYNTGTESKFPFMKIIGEAFAHSVMISDEYIVLNKERKEIINTAIHKPETFISVTVNFD